MSDSANNGGSAKRAANGNDVNIVNLILGVVILIALNDYPGKLLFGLASALPVEQFAAAGKSGVFGAFVALWVSRPAGLRQWLALLAGVATILLAGLVLVVICALAFGATGLIPPPVAGMEEPGNAVGMMVGILVLIPFVGGLGKVGLLPDFRWPYVWKDDNAEPAVNSWLPPRFANLLAWMTVVSLFAGSAPLLLDWTGRNWPDSPLTLINPGFAVFPLVGAAGLAVLTGIFAAKGWRPWPLTALVALLGGFVMAGLMVALALAAGLLAWQNATDSTLTAFVSGLPVLALIPLGITAYRAQTRGGAESEGDGP